MSVDFFSLKTHVRKEKKYVRDKSIHEKIELIVYRLWVDPLIWITEHVRSFVLCIYLEKHVEWISIVFFFPFDFVEKKTPQPTTLNVVASLPVTSKWTRQGAIIKGSRPSSPEESSPILLHAQEGPLPLVIVVCLGLLWLWVFCRYVLQKMILWSTILMFAMFGWSFYTTRSSKYCIVNLCACVLLVMSHRYIFEKEKKTEFILFIEVITSILYAEKSFVFIDWKKKRYFNKFQGKGLNFAKFFTIRFCFEIICIATTSSINKWFTISRRRIIVKTWKSCFTHTDYFR